MEPTKECPLCGERMRRKDHEEISYLPGTAEVRTVRSSEWVCPDCDYFEEIEDGDRPS